MKIKAPEKPAAKSNEAAKPPVNKRRHPNAMPTSLDRNPIGMSPERRALYEEAQQHVESGDVTPPTESEEAGPETAETTPEEVVADVPPEEEKPKGAEAKPEEEAEASKPDEVPADKHTTVPYAALHEARQELKEVKAQMKEALETAQKQLQIVIQENERLRKAKEETTTTTEEEVPIDNLEGYVKDLGKKLKATQDELNRLKENDLEEKQRGAATKLNQAIELAANELKAEGYPGFEKFRDQVAAAIERRAKGDDAKIRALDNIEGWKEVYKEDVYPEIAGIFGAVKKDTKKAEKEELKGKANLAGNPGSAPKKPEDEPKKPWGLGTYFEMRQKNKPS